MVSAIYNADYTVQSQSFLKGTFEGESAKVVNERRWFSPICNEELGINNKPCACDAPCCGILHRSYKPVLGMLR